MHPERRTTFPSRPRASSWHDERPGSKCFLDILIVFPIVGPLRWNRQDMGTGRWNVSYSGLRTLATVEVARFGPKLMAWYRFVVYMHCDIPRLYGVDDLVAR